MHYGDAVTDQPISREVARSAANWLSLLHSGEASHADQQACLAWRNASPEHEKAWMRAEIVQQKLGLISPSLGEQTLNREQRYDRRRALKVLALLIVAGPLAYTTYRELRWQQYDHHTATGEQRQLTLEDGTKLMLNTATAVDISFSPQQRLLTLHQGEILLETASDPQQRPLLVQTAQGKLRPVGTRFTVRQFTDVTRLGVMAGEVEVLPEQGVAHRFLPGQQADFDQYGIKRVHTLTEQADSWSQGVLYANAMPLGQFVQELARYRKGTLRCDPDAENLIISGVFKLNNSDHILAALPDTLPVKVNSLLGLWVTVKAR